MENRKRQRKRLDRKITVPREKKIVREKTLGKTDEKIAHIRMGDTISKQNE